MYNGIGLTTARGSATSGHVTKNLTYIKPEFFRNKLSQNQGQGRPHQDEKTKALAHKKGNQDILEHNEKRSIEAKIFEFQEKLLEQGMPEDQVEAKVQSERERLTNASRRNSKGRDGSASKGSRTDTHAIAAQKSRELDRTKNAFGIRNGYQEGNSFDPELMKVERQKQKEEWQQRRQAREARASERGRERNQYDQDRNGMYGNDKGMYGNDKGRDNYRSI